MVASRIGVGALAVVALLVGGVCVQADVIQQTPGTDFLVFEAEQYDSIEGDEFTGWLEVGPGGDLESELGNQVLQQSLNVGPGQDALRHVLVPCDVPRVPIVVLWPADSEGFDEEQASYKAANVGKIGDSAGRHRRDGEQSVEKLQDKPEA